MSVTINSCFRGLAIAAAVALSGGAAVASTAGPGKGPGGGGHGGGKPVADWPGGGPGGNYCKDINDCSLDGSRAIVKFNFDDDLTDGDGTGFELDAISSHFGSVLGSEFSFVFASGGEITTADFTYILGAGDPTLTGVVVKGGMGNDGGSSADIAFDASLGSFGGFTGKFDSSGIDGKGISNVTFFNGGATPPVPLPAAGFLLLSAFGGMTLLRRRRRPT